MGIAGLCAAHMEHGKNRSESGVSSAELTETAKEGIRATNRPAGTKRLSFLNVAVLRENTETQSGVAWRRQQDLGFGNVMSM